jgi:hypothetical protein
MRWSEHPQGSEGWFADRLGIATASCFADVMATVKTGEATERKKYRARLVVERLTRKPLATFENAAMKQGREREPHGRAGYEALTGHLVQEVGLCLHDTIEAGASPDGLVGKRGGLEIKCPELPAHLEYLKLDAEPAAYRWQIQGQMWICELDWVDFVSFNPDFPEHLQLIVRRIKRDEDAIKKLAEAVAQFMAEVREEEQRIRNLKVAA